MIAYFRKSVYENRITFWIFTCALVAGLTLPILIQHAMFQDAMLYSCVSHNLGIGHGTFWFPQYSTLNIEGIPSFHEQLPLVFGIQAIFFYIFGDSIYVERFFVMGTIALHMYLIHKIWLLTFAGHKNMKKVSWLPVFLWIIIPIGFWSFRGNMLENTVSVFSLLAVYYCCKVQKRTEVNWDLLLLAGFFTFLASFSKGIPGLFTLSFPFIYWITQGKISWKEALRQTLLMLSVPVIIYGLFLLHPTSYESLRIYVVERLLARVSSMPTTSSRFETPWRLIQELIPIFMVCILFFFITKKEKRKEYFTQKSKALFFILLGLSAILPLMLTMVQKGWYMVPGFPYLAIGFASLLAPNVARKIEFMKSRRMRIFLRLLSITAAIWVFVFTIKQVGKISRHEDMVRDVWEIGSYVDAFATITVPEEMYYQYDFVLQGFLVRYHNISISPYKQYKYFLKEKDMKQAPPEGYYLLDLPLRNYQLYLKKNRPVREYIPMLDEGKRSKNEEIYDNY